MPPILRRLPMPMADIRILLDRGSRNSLDYPILWTTLMSPIHEFEKNRLENIYVQQDADGNGNFETTIRSYHLTLLRMEM